MARRPIVLPNAQKCAVAVDDEYTLKKGGVQTVNLKLPQPSSRECDYLRL